MEDKRERGKGEENGEKGDKKRWKRGRKMKRRREREKEKEEEE